MLYEKKGGICTLVTGYKTTPIYVISTCPIISEYTSVRTLCEYTNPILRLNTESVIDLTRTPVQDCEGFVYKNIYCAQCNGVTSMQAWETKLDCDNLQTLALSDGTTMVTPVNHFSGRSLGCTRLLAPAIPTMIHECSHIDATLARLHQTRIGNTAKTDVSPFPLSFSILMNFGFDGKTHILFTSAPQEPYVQCNVNEKYDPVNDKCRPIICNSGYRLVDGTCQKIVNYDIEPNTDDLSTLSDTEDPLQITLTIKNITYGDKMMLEYTVSKEALASTLASMFNISTERIKNLQINFVNDTSILNHTENKFVEIHRFTTPPPTPYLKITEKDNMEQKSLYVSAEPYTAGYQFIDGSEREKRRNRGSKNSNGARKLNVKSNDFRHTTINSETEIKPTLDTSSTTITYGLTSKSGIERSSAPPKVKFSRVTNREKRMNVTTNIRTDRQNLASLLQESQNETLGSANFQNAEDSIKHDKTPSLKENSEQYIHDSAEIDKTGQDGNIEATESSEDRWYKHLGISVRISFILEPAHRNQTLLEKSVKTVIQSMSELIKSNDFMLTINGTDYRVEGVENSPEPASMDLFCRKGFHPFMDETDFELLNVLDQNTGVNVTIISVNKTGKTYYPGQYDLTFTIDGNMGDLNQTHVTSFAFVCDMPTIANKECDRIVLSEKEFQVFLNKSIKFSGHIYNTSEYEYIDEENNTVAICTPDWITAQLVYDTNKWTMACGQDLVKLVIAESYLTFILGLISLICMLSVIVTYSIFDKLRNLPGINTMNLTLSLFLGELLFIVSGWIQPHQEWLCSAFGIILHYLFLASFFWTNVMSFDVFKTFARKCILRRIRNKKKYVPIYSAYAWGVPLLIVSLCALFDFGNIIDGVEIGYGGNSVSDHSSEDLAKTNKTGSKNGEETKHVYSIGCWIQEPVASMAVFGGPMILILLSNAVMFTRTIICIRASTRATKSSVRKSSLNHMAGKDDVMLYIRMSTVMGFTWVFGLASSVVSAFASPPSRTTCIILHLLGMLFIVFNCSQGIFIFFAFVFNRRVLGLYRELISKLRTKKERPISISVSRGTLTTNASDSSVSHIT